MISQAALDDYNRRKLATLIREVSALHGGEPDYDPQTGEVLGETFLSEYIADVIKEWSNDLVAAIACFEDLKAQSKWTQPKGGTLEKPKGVTVTPIKGHAAFREYYEQLERDKTLG